MAVWLDSHAAPVVSSARGSTSAIIEKKVAYKIAVGTVVSSEVVGIAVRILQQECVRRTVKSHDRFIPTTYPQIRDTEAYYREKPTLFGPLSKRIEYKFVFLVS
ncbi:hypothetical protein CBL_01258 [Carabus blaptoides fortunei]